MRAQAIGGEVGLQRALLLPAGVQQVLLRGAQGTAKQVFEAGDEPAELRADGPGGRAERDVLRYVPQVSLVFGSELGQETEGGGTGLGIGHGILAEGLGDALDQRLGHDLASEGAIDPELRAGQIKRVIPQLHPLTTQVAAGGVAVALQGHGAELVGRAQGT